MNQIKDLQGFIGSPKNLMGMSSELALLLVNQIGGEKVLNEIIDKDVNVDVVSVSLLNGFDDDAKSVDLYQKNKELFLTFLNEKHDVINNYHESVSDYILTKSKAARIKRGIDDPLKIDLSTVQVSLYDPSIKVGLAKSRALEPMVFVCRDALMFMIRSYGYYKKDVDPIELVDTYFDKLKKEGKPKIAMLAITMRSAFESNQTFIDEYHDYLDGFSGIIGLNPALAEEFFFKNREILLSELKDFIQHSDTNAAKEGSVVKFIAEAMVNTDNLDAIGFTMYGIDKVDRYTHQEFKGIINDISNTIIGNAVLDFDRFIKQDYANLNFKSIAEKSHE